MQFKQLLYSFEEIPLEAYFFNQRLGNKILWQKISVNELVLISELFDSPNVQLVLISPSDSFDSHRAYEIWNP